MLALTLLMLSSDDVPYAGKLIVQPTIADAEVLVDGELCDSPCEIDVSAGYHDITVRKDGYETRTITGRVAANEQNFVSVKLYPEPTTDQRALIARNVRIAAWSAAGGAVLAGVAALIVNFAAYRPAVNAYADHFANQRTDPSLETLQNHAALSQELGNVNRLNIATAGFAIAAGLAAATSLTLFLFGPRAGATAASTEVKPVAWSPILAPTQGGAQLGLNLIY